MRSHIPHDQVVVSSVGDKLFAGLLEALSHASRVGDDLFAVLLESGSRNLLKLDGESTDLVVVGTALKHGEDSKVNLVEQWLLAVDDA